MSAERGPLFVDMRLTDGKPPSDDTTKQELSALAYRTAHSQAQQHRARIVGFEAVHLEERDDGVYLKFEFIAEGPEDLWKRKLLVVR